MPRFREVYGDGIGRPINAIAYELTDGGDLVRHKPWTWTALLSHVMHQVRSFSDMDTTNEWSEARVKKDLDIWLKVNEEKDAPPRDEVPAVYRDGRNMDGSDV